MSRPSLLEELPEDDPWPPDPRDADFAVLDLGFPEPVVTSNSMIYLIKEQPSKVFKFHSAFREYQLQKAAGDCAVRSVGR
jgi:hypothetical protein